MNEKQIDLDAMRALAREAHDYNNNQRYSPFAGTLADALDAGADEIEQLRKDCADYAETKKRDTESYMAMDAGIRELEATVEQLRKERDTLRGFIELETEQCPKSHVGGPCGQCTARRAALAAQGDKPHD